MVPLSNRSDVSDRSDKVGKHPRGCHSASPVSKLAEPMTRGKGGAVYPSTLVVALGWVCATTRVVYYTVCHFPRWSFGGVCPLRRRGYLNGTLSVASWGPLPRSQDLVYDALLFLVPNQITSRTKPMHFLYQTSYLCMRPRIALLLRLKSHPRILLK